MNYMTVAQLYEWTKERGLENKCILTFDNYGELCHYVDSGEIEVRGEDLVIQLVEKLAIFMQKWFTIELDYDIIEL